MQEKKHAFDALDMQSHLERYLAEGMDRKMAMKAVAKDRGLTKREVYRALLRPRT